MIRKNALFCKLIQLNVSSKDLHNSFMRKFRPELETCPVCSSRGGCRIHACYGRSSVDLIRGNVRKSSLCITRVICDSCGCTHAILPDYLIPYSAYGPVFILAVLAARFLTRRSVEWICERFRLTRSLFYHWLSLWKEHKRLWLGVLDDLETDDAAFLSSLRDGQGYSPFSMNFIRRFSFSFLQGHANPVPRRPPAAPYCQQVFGPDTVLS